MDAEFQKTEGMGSSLACGCVSQDGTVVTEVLLQEKLLELPRNPHLRCKRKLFIQGTLQHKASQAGCHEAAGGCVLLTIMHCRGCMLGKFLVLWELVLGKSGASCRSLAWSTPKLGSESHFIPANTL